MAEFQLSSIDIMSIAEARGFYLGAEKAIGMIHKIEGCR